MSWPSIDHSLLSPSGHISQRARTAALARESARLFPNGLPAPSGPPQPTEAERLRRQAAELLALAERGMKPRAYRRQAADLLARADALD